MELESGRDLVRVGVGVGGMQLELRVRVRERKRLSSSSSSSSRALQTPIMDESSIITLLSTRQFNATMRSFNPLLAYSINIAPCSIKVKSAGTGTFILFASALAPDIICASI